MAIPELDEPDPLRPRRERARLGCMGANARRSRRRSWHPSSGIRVFGVSFEDSLPLPLRPRRARRGAGGVIAIALALILNVAAILGTVWVLAHQQRLIDQVAVWQFAPSLPLVTYADRSTMTEEGRFLFFASRPEIAGEGQFDDICSSRLEDVGILGCYLPSERTIFLYDVTDARLDGIEEVVAAHEMLHAAWDRMPVAQRSALGVLLEAEVAARADDAALAETLEFYAIAEPGERLNELHSIVGTEFGQVSAALEQHYAKYFDDRSALVTLHEQSNAVFEQQAAEIDALVVDIDELNASITADYASYNAGYDQLNADIDRFNARADSSGFSSQSQFNTERAALMQRQADLKALYASIDARVAEHDGLLAQLDELNTKVAELNEAINISPRDDGGL